MTYYLSEFHRDSLMPLIVYVQGSGNKSLFGQLQDGRIYPLSGHIQFAYEAKDKAKVLVIEKPGVHYLETTYDNKDFDQKFSLQSWTDYIIAAIIMSQKQKILIAPKY